MTHTTVRPDRSRSGVVEGSRFCADASALVIRRGAQRPSRIATVGSTLKINIASDYPRKKDDGSWDDNTHWNIVTVFAERTIEWIKANTKPGDLVHARGRIRNGSYEKDGDKIYTTDLVTTEFLLLAKHQPKDADDSLVGDEA